MGDVVERKTGVHPSSHGCYDLDEGVGQVSDNWSTLGRSMVNDAVTT